VVTAGGVGRIVEAGAATSLAAPGASAGAKSASSGAGATAGSGTASADAVFPQASGVVGRLLVTPGQRVVAGQPLVVLADGGSTDIGVELARNELLAAQLEAAQQRSNGAGTTDLALGFLKVDAASKRLAIAQLAADRMTVRAPRAGTVTSVLTAVGAPADGTTPIMTVADLGALAVDVDVSEFDAAKVRVGQKATISVDALGGASYTGSVEVEALAGVDNGGVVTFPVRLTMSPGATGVKPGMSASVRIVVDERRGVTVLPLEAVANAGTRATVAMVGAQGRVTSRAVALGVADNKFVEVRRGLRPGDRVQLRAAKGA
jgi:multidrug efflux pump subunit AcrA (membrane-fusion protein)